ncbi:uncharacterized protein ARMOST_10372 [Armillaria ostoyae]|uniref:Uncharacterized protein n=1 Tax=Armillaria ostoyae TaxID=47428 RepID=A0A284RE44_ARMOS|nr:uncharacterized protein ARMOST_10372 [Armillaria ostoyae]
MKPAPLPAASKAASKAKKVKITNQAPQASSKKLSKKLLSKKPTKQLPVQPRPVSHKPTNRSRKVISSDDEDMMDTQHQQPAVAEDEREDNSKGNENAEDQDLESPRLGKRCTYDCYF